MKKTLMAVALGLFLTACKAEEVQSDTFEDKTQQEAIQEVIGHVECWYTDKLPPTHDFDIVTLNSGTRGYIRGSHTNFDVKTVEGKMFTLSVEKCSVEFYK